MAKNRFIARALVSVSDKTGLVEFCSELKNFGVEIISTGGTAKWLRDYNIPTIEVSEITGFPEMMDGRVKTLHPKIHAAILARDEDQDILQQFDITPIDLVIVNLYPFSKTVKKENCTLEMAIENIDIGGPTLLRAAAKNCNRVTVVSDSNDYERIIQEMKNNNGGITEATRYNFAMKVFINTALYDREIGNYFNRICSKEDNSKFQPLLNIELLKKQDLRYGENPHQGGALYVEVGQSEQGIANANQVQGKELSYNNIADADAALGCVRNFMTSHACVIVKHANPCGVACSADQITAYNNAFACDPTSAFGGIIAFNQIVREKTAKKILENQFVEVVIAPDFSRGARKIFSKKTAIRLMSVGNLHDNQNITFDLKRVSGGILVQESDSLSYKHNEMHCVTKIKPTTAQLQDLQFAWSVVKYVKSNAIVFVRDTRTVGIGAGQMSRIDSSKIAVQKAIDANLELKGAVMASDAFFPFRDALDIVSKLGIGAIIQPGGSIRDDEVIAAAEEAKIAMVFTGIRHFRH